MPKKRQQAAEKVVRSLLSLDGFSAWMGIELVEIEPGRAVLQMNVRPEMLNGFKSCHGGIIFSLADTALAFAANSHGRLCVLAEANISYPESVYEGETLTAIAEELSVRNRIATYNVNIIKSDGAKVGLFRGTVYRTSKKFEIKDKNSEDL